MSYYFTGLLLFRKHIERTYINTRYNIQTELWKLLHPKHFVNVMLIHHIEHNREEEIFDTVTTMRHGLVSQKYILPWDAHFTIHSKSKQSLKSTKTNEILNIFLPYENSDGSISVPKYILIEGAAGMGKTTLCKEITYRWAKQGLLKDIKLVFLVYLRDPDIVRMKCLNDLVHYLYNFDGSAADLSKQCAQELITRDNSDVMIILDGYDEFNNSEHSLITSIMGRKILPQSRIVVTSRLTASDKLHRVADVRVEILGFTNKSKAEYIKEELKGFPDKIKKLQFYLNRHAAVNSLCYMPIMMTILVYLFKEKEDLPTDSTELYHKFLALTISHHLQKQNKTEDLFVSLQCLPTNHKNLLLDLSKFAFLTLKSNKKVFSYKDITSLCPNSILANTSLENFGLLVSVQYFSTDKGNSRVFNFLHLSIQEYLSAYYINSIDQHKQFNELETTFLNEQYKETWSTFVAINKKHCLTFQDFLIYCKHKHHEELSSCIADFNNLSSIQRFVELSIKIIYSNAITSNHIQLLIKNNDKSACVYHWQFYLSFCSTKFGFPKMLEMFLLDKYLTLENWNNICNAVVQYESLACILIDTNRLFGFKINQQQLIKCFKLNIIFNSVALRNCHITNSTVDAIMSYLSNFCYMSFVTLNNCSFEQGGFTRLSRVFNKIKAPWNFNVINMNFTEEDVDGLVLIILNNYKLQSLYLRHNNFEGGITKLAKLADISQNTLQFFLQNYDLGDNTIIDETSTNLGGVILNKSIFGNDSITQEAPAKSAYNLKELFMYHNNLQSSAITFLQSLITISKLKVIDIDSNEVTEEGSKALASVILHNTGLEKLHLNNNIFGSGMLNIMKILKQVTSFKSIDLGNNNLSKEVSDELALAIQANNDLEELHLYNANLKSSAVVILKSLCNISTLKILHLSDNNMPPETGEALASVILCNTGLQELNLINNNLDEEVLRVAEVLKCIASLRKLYLSKNNISKTVSHELALAIKSYKCLETLWLSNCNLKSSVVAIFQALSTISSLKCLSISNNQITEEAGEALASVILHNRGLEILYLRNNNLGKGMLEIVKALQHITSLKSLDLSKNNISNEVSVELAVAIKSNKHLEELWMLDCNLKSLVTVILQSLTTISSLKGLDVNDNQVSKEAGEALASVISRVHNRLLVILHNTGLKELYIRNNNLGKGMLKIAKALQHINSLESLNLSNNNISNEVSVELAIAFKSNKHLKKLWMFDCNLKSSATVILQSLTTISTLKCLSIGNNQITPEAAKVLPSVILHNTELEELYLRDSNIGEGRLDVLKALQCFKSLKILDLSNNKMLKQDCNELALVIKSNRQLEKLYLEELYHRSNSVGKGMLEVAKALQHITSLKSLNLSINNISNEVSVELAIAFKSNKYLEELWMFDCNLTSSVIVILQALTTTSTLKCLSIGNNQITPEAAKVLASVILHNTKLGKLYLRKIMVG